MNGSSQATFSGGPGYLLLQPKCCNAGALADFQLDSWLRECFDMELLVVDPAGLAYVPLRSSVPLKRRRKLIRTNLPQLAQTLVSKKSGECFSGWHFS